MAQEHKKLVWITGASSGLGRAIALELAKRNYIVAATARRKEKLLELSNLNKNIVSYPSDIIDRNSIIDLVKKIEQENGPIDIAILNAGARYETYTNNIFDNNFRKTLEVNIGGTINCLEAISSKMMKRKTGHIAVVSSIGGYIGIPFFGIAYITSKAAQRIMIESAVIPLSKFGVKLQIICPGFIGTDIINEKLLKNISKMKPEKAAKIVCDGIKSNKFEIAFPKLLSVFVKIYRLLPYKISIFLGKSWLKWIKIFNPFSK